jgi:SH3 domain protein
MNARTTGWMVSILALVGVLSMSTAAGAAWVKDEVHLQLRTGAGSGYRIVGQITTGDSVTIVSRTDNWTEVRTNTGKTGWVPAGFLQSEPPARIALAKLEADTAALRSDFEQLTEQTATLRTSNEELSGDDAGQRDQIDQLTRENYELRAGARWPEWITGAGIVFAGMLLGWVLSRSSGRRRQQRIRL